MGRVVHFEIHVDDIERAKAFYGSVFGWTFQDWTAFTGSPYWGALTGMAWQGYYFDTDGNMFGIHQPDVNAK